MLSTAVAKEIHKNIGGLQGYGLCGGFAREILSQGSYKNIAKTRYVNDKQITDHYAIIPTGQGLNNLQSLAPVATKVYEVIVRRFLSVFYPAAVYQKVSLQAKVAGESFFAGFKVLAQEGYLKVTQYSFSKKSADAGSKPQGTDKQTGQVANQGEEVREDGGEEEEQKCDEQFMALLKGLKKGSKLSVKDYEIKEGRLPLPSATIPAALS